MREYVPAPLPTLLMLETTGATDRWLRDDIRGTADAPAPSLQFVVVADSHEADRVFQAWAQMKLRKGIAVGGACSVRYDGPETIAREKARYGC